MRLKSFNQFMAEGVVDRRNSIADVIYINEGREIGDCYQAAGRLIMEWANPSSILVHGMVNGQGSLDGLRFGHAWVEKGNKVYDYSNGKSLSLPKKVYYQMGGIEKQDNKYYKWRDSLKWMVDEGHWGPWEMSGTTETVMENLPDEADGIGQLRQEIRGSELKKIENELDESLVINESMSKKNILEIVDRVYPQIVNNLGKSKYVETPTVELHKDIYARVSGIEGAEGEHSTSSEAEYDDAANKIFIYYPNMKDEKHIIQSLLHEYTHALQDPEKWAEARKDGYENNPFEKEASRAERNWKKYI